MAAARAPEFDCIVVGGGSAGAALAARLSEAPSRRVLLLEAGRDWRSAEAPPEMRRPNWLPLLQPGGEFRWADLRARLAPDQPEQPLLRGRGMGGSSAINGTAAKRALPEDFAAWPAGWSFQEVLPSFIRLERDCDFPDAPYHGESGPVPIWRAPRERWGAVDRGLFDAASAAGFPWCEDMNAPGATGLSPVTRNAVDGVRVSSNDAYLEPARGRANLTIWGGSPVDRVLLDGTRAMGVRLRRGGEWLDVAAGEVFLSAGVVHSPAILLRSGIGPAGELRRLGIEVRLDLPGVGQNLSDHPMWTLVLPLRPEARASSESAQVSCCALAETSGLEGAGPNDLLYLGLNLWGVGEAAWPCGRLAVALVRCFSRGELRLASADPDVPPRIEVRMLVERSDLVRLRHGARRALELVRGPHFASILEAEPFVAGLELGLADVAGEAELDASLRRDIYTFNHGVGTCRMGRADDADAVVDPDCRVRGAAGLHVVDASVMPEVPRAYTHLTTVMIAEHVAGRMG